MSSPPRGKVERQLHSYTDRHQLMRWQGATDLDIQSELRARISDRNRWRKAVLRIASPGDTPLWAGGWTRWRRPKTTATVVLQSTARRKSSVLSNNFTYSQQLTDGLASPASEGSSPTPLLARAAFNAPRALWCWSTRDWEMLLHENQFGGSPVLRCDATCPSTRSFPPHRMSPFSDTFRDPLFAASR